mgnify:CR=1 FL=1
MNKDKLKVSFEIDRYKVIGMLSRNCENAEEYNEIMDILTANDKCIGCGKCAKMCPLNNIKLKNSKPVWGKNCTHCMACICLCPTEAIEYGKKSVGKPRYHLD